MEFAYDGGGLAKGGDVSLFIDGQKVGEGRVEMTEPFCFSADETVDVGMEAGSPVSPDYGPQRQRLQRRGQLGGDRRRQGSAGPGSLPGPGRALPRGDGAAVRTSIASLTCRSPIG